MSLAPFIRHRLPAVCGKRRAAFSQVFQLWYGWCIGIFLRKKREPKKCRRAYVVHRALVMHDTDAHLVCLQGFGITRVLEDGELLEKAACSVSVIHGVLTPERAQVGDRPLAFLLVKFISPVPPR